MEQTYTVRFEADTSNLQSGVASMFNRIGSGMQSMASFANQTMNSMGGSADFAMNSVQGAYGSAQLGGAYAAASVGGAYGTLNRAYNTYMGARQDLTSTHSGQLFAGMQSAAAAHPDHLSSNFAGMTHGLGHFGATFGSGMAVAGADAMLGKAMGGASFGGFAAIGAGMGRSAASLLRLGKLGRSAGALIGGATGMFLPYMLAEATVGMISDDIVQQNELAQAIGGLDVSNNRSIMGTGRSRFTVGQRRDMAKYMMNMSDQIDRADFGHGKIGMQGLTQILHESSKDLFSDPSLTPDKFRQLFEKKVKQVRDFAMAFDKSIGEAAKTVEQLRQQGFSNPVQAAGMIGNHARFAGMTSTGMLGVTKATGDYFVQNDLGRKAGAVIGMQSASDAGTMHRMGMISGSDLQRVGGVKGFASQNAQLQAAFMNSDLGQTVLAAAVRGGKVDQSTINQIASGQMSTAQLLNRSGGLASGGVNALSDFYANRGQYARQLSANQQFGALGSMAIRMLRVSNMDVNQTNLATAFRSQFGLSETMSRMMAKRISDPSIVRAQLAATQQRMLDVSRRADAADKPGLGTFAAAGALNILSAGLTIGTLGLVSPGGFSLGDTRRFGENVSNFFGGMRSGFRRNISQPVGNALSSMSRGWQDLKDDITGTIRYNTTADMGTVDAMVNSGGTGGLSSSLTRDALDAQSSQVLALAGRVSKEYTDNGRDVPAWVKKLQAAKVQMLGGKARFSRSMLSDSDLKDVTKAIRQRESIEDGVLQGYRMSAAAAKKRFGNFSSAADQRVISALRDAADSSGRIDSTTAMRLFAGDTPADQLTKDQTTRLGAMLQSQGLSLDNRGRGPELTRLIAKSVQLAQKQDEAAQGKIADLFDTDLVFVDYKQNSFQSVFGRDFANTMQDTGKSMQRDVTELMGHIVKGGPESRKEIRRLIKNVQDRTANMPKAKRLALMKIVNMGNRYLTKKLTARDKKDIQALKDNKFDQDALSLVEKAKGFDSVAAQKAMSKQYADRLGLALDASIRKGDTKVIEDRLSKSDVEKKAFQNLVNQVKGVADGDVSANLKKLSRMSQDKNLKRSLALMEQKGGGLRQIARFVKNMANTRDLQKGDLLAGIEDKDKVIKGMLSDDALKGIKTEKQAKAQYDKLVDRIRRTGSKTHQAQIQQLDKALGGLTSFKDKLKVLSKLDDNKGDDSDFVRRAILARSTTAASGQQVISTTAGGTWSNVADKQIAALQQVHRGMLATVKTIEALHDKIKTGRKINLKGTG